MIVVTGARGLLGSAILEALSQKNQPCTGLSRTDVDLLDFDATLRWFRTQSPEIVIHTAARVHGLMGNLRFPVDVFEENTLINTNVVKAARMSGTRKFVAAGTVAAYPGDQVLDIQETNFLSGEPHAGERAYAFSKRSLLAHLEATKSQYGIDYAYAILTNLYGPNDRFDIENGHVIPSLVAKFYQASRTGSGVDVWGSGRAKRDFLYVKDAAAALVRMTQAGSGLINVASGTSVPISCIVEILSALSGVTQINWQTDKPEGQFERSYNVARLKALEFEPAWSLEDGLAETYAWYKTHGGAS